MPAWGGRQVSLAPISPTGTVMAVRGLHCIGSQYVSKQALRPLCTFTGAGDAAGGRLNVSISSKGLTKAPGVWPDMHCTIRGTNLHAPQAERLLELPMDITEGALPP